ncbi:MAG: hypothetical protein F6J86_29100 [Symploca sp. SIO1B1]|nr:hypothetical protein [Symploca sp. SIO1B1]
MAKLNQIIAIEKDVSSKSNRVITDASQTLQKPAPLSGISRSYRPKDEEGDQLPSESTRVQVKGEQVVAEVFTAITKLLNITATKDYANCEARADIVVDGQVIVPQAPTTFLLFLEKKLIEIQTFIQKLPTLDPADEWHKDMSQDSWATTPTQTTRTKKVPRNHVKAEATDKHPAQVEVFYEDIIVGYWTTIKYSGAFPATEVNQMLARVEKLREAVKFAREEANTMQVTQQDAGDRIAAYLSGTSYTANRVQA